jgi:hypothetical protein
MAVNGPAERLAGQVVGVEPAAVVADPPAGVVPPVRVVVGLVAEPAAVVAVVPEPVVVVVAGGPGSWKSRVEVAAGVVEPAGAETVAVRVTGTPWLG